MLKRHRKGARKLKYRDNRIKNVDLDIVKKEEESLLYTPLLDKDLPPSIKFNTYSIVKRKVIVKIEERDISFENLIT